MKKLDKIIQEEVHTALNEQVQKKPEGRPAAVKAISGTALTDPYITPTDPRLQLGKPWPSNVPRKKATPQIEAFFKKMGAVPYSVTGMADKEKNSYPIWHFNLGDEHYRFHYNPGSKYNLLVDNKNHKLYWKYVHDAAIAGREYSKNYTYNNNSGLFPDGYDIKATAKKMRILKNRVAMSAAGEWGTNEEHHSQIQAFADSEGVNALWCIYLYNDKPFFAYMQSKKFRSDAEYARMQKEKDHAVLDLLGFIPIIGDIGDLYNACWYFADWANEGHKWQDMISGLLSLVAVWGPVGSAFKAVVKPAFARLGKIITSSADLSNPKTLLQIVRTISINTGTGTISAKQAKALAGVLDTISDAMVKYKLKFKEALQKLGVEDPDALLIEIETLLVKLEKAAEQVAEYSSKAKKVATNLDDPIIQSLDKVNFYTHVARGWSSMAYKNSALEAANISIPLIRKLGFGLKTANITRLNTEMLMAAVTNRQAKRTIKQIEKSFTAGIVADPTRAIALFQTATNKITKQRIRISVMNTIGENVQTMAMNTVNVLKGGAVLLPAQMAEFYRVCPRLYKAGQIVETASMPVRTLNTLIRNGWVPNTTKTFAYMAQGNPKELDNMLIRYGNTEIWTGAAEAISRTCVKNGHPVWNYIVSDPAQHLKTLMPESVGDFFKMLGNNLLDGKKWLDVYWSFIRNGAADIKQPDEEHHESYVYKALIKSMLESTPEWSKENVMPLVKKYIETTRSTILPRSEVSKSALVAGIHPDSTTIPAGSIRPIAPNIKPKKPVTGVNALKPRGKALKNNPFLKTL
jgi:hypothetical protein